MKNEEDIYAGITPAVICMQIRAVFGLYRPTQDSYPIDENDLPQVVEKLENVLRAKGIAFTHESFRSLVEKENTTPSWTVSTLGNFIHQHLCEFPSLKEQK